ncbi:DNA repair protein RecN [Mariniphaga sediminis]|uniref:DNA repair protein RecN n=1 Tax=Mariniphaga sediminis TaxID=1628158 RepID=UPI0035615B0C
MLVKLTISNYALISKLDVEFHTGLNSVTGETGAGKSIILGALGLILGNRADLSVLKNQDEKCIVEGIFEVGNYHLQSFFKKNDLDYDTVAILRREITPSGKSRAFVNDTPVNLKTLRELGLKLIDIHSQHQNLELGNRKFQLHLVDTVAGTEKVLNEYREKYSRFITLKNDLEKLIEKSEKERADLDYWQFQFNQLEEAGLKEAEQEELEAELEQLTHAEEIKSVFSEVQQLLDDESFSVIQNLKESGRKLESIQEYVAEVPGLTERLQSSFLEIKDIFDEVERLAGKVEHDPARIELVNDRLNLLYSLQQKHNVATAGELIELKNSFDEKINQVTGYDQEIESLKTEFENSRLRLEEKADELSRIRKKSFELIEKAVRKDLQQLGMPKSKLEVVHEPLPGYTPVGKDAVSFLFSSNADMPADEISKIASGGEMSRLMLAIKNLLRTSKALPTVIFDEIDTGVSGEISLKMGNILKEFSISTQIINITHLPQIAARGNAHFMVYKYEQNGKTYTSIRQLNGKERVEELAKMVGGENLTDTTLKAAEELLKQ